jgi:glutamyl-tRNA synthetase
LIVLRSDGTPIYNLAVVSDDIAMAITLVMRGDDHISNTPKQVLLYQALGAPAPAFAHLPMIGTAPPRSATTSTSASSRGRCGTSSHC